MDIPVSFLFVLDLMRMLLVAYKKNDREDGIPWVETDCREVDALLKYGRRYTLEFIDTPFVGTDAKYYILYSDKNGKNEEIVTTTWKELVDYLF